jgi:2-polyprenyl-6-methoxyphenol hydroxylase-like FAD-dependent oxidoreductase
MAIEDAWVLSEHSKSLRDSSGAVSWDAVLAAYNAVRPEHCRRVLGTSRTWGDLWHLDGAERERRNGIPRSRDIHDYTYIDWLCGPTALTPEQENPMFDVRTQASGN